jgi:hypothetical protein
VQNYYAAQIKPGGMSEAQRLDLETKTGRVKEGQTNWFQLPREELSPPRNVKVVRKQELEITWDTAYAADAPLSHYEVFHGNKKVATVKHRPQATKKPFAFQGKAEGGEYKIVTVDRNGNRAESEIFQA